MGFVLRGKSKWRTLSEAETEIYGGSSLRRLYGCVFTMQNPQMHQPVPGIGGKTRRGSEITSSKSVQEQEQQLLTWSQVLFWLRLLLSLIGCLEHAQIKEMVFCMCCFWL
jgi:hypothetical protein